MEDEQPVAAAADDRAGDEMDIFVGGGGLDGWLARHVEGQRFAGGIAGVVRRGPTGCRQRHRAVGFLRRNLHRRVHIGGRLHVAELVGGHVGLEIVGGHRWFAVARWRRQRDFRGGGVVWTGRGAACGFVAHRWSFPRPVPGNLRRGSAPHDRRARPTPWHGRIPLMSVREGPASRRLVGQHCRWLGNRPPARSPDGQAPRTAASAA